jgi:hypothetical protein
VNEFLRGEFGELTFDRMAAIQTWTPGFLHLGWTQWLILAGYIVAAGLCFRSGAACFRRDSQVWKGWRQALTTSFQTLLSSFRGSPAPQNRKIAALWFLAGSCLAFLAVNRALGLDTGLTILFRNIALREGWYADRRIFQLLAVLLLAAGVVLVLLLGRWLNGRIPYLELRIVLVATLLLLGFVAIRACSFHDVDAVLARTLAGFRLGGLAEFAAILLVAVSAFLFRRRNMSVDRHS